METNITEDELYFFEYLKFSKDFELTEKTIVESDKNIKTINNTNISVNTETKILNSSRKSFAYGGTFSEIRGIQVWFPYSPYHVQLEFMSKVIQSLQDNKNALLESPTGTGKTLCLLCSVLAWRQTIIEEFLEHGNENSIHTLTNCVVPKIIYASRTHSQLTQVVNEIKKLRFRYPNLKTCVLGSRSQLCIHPNVSTIKGESQNLLCRHLVSKDNCKYYKAQQEFPLNFQQITDIEDLQKYGKANSFCPYYYSRELQKEADITFLPYNYLVDSKIRESLNLNLSNSILIFDEAHNLEVVCNESSSFDFTNLDLEMAIKETEKCIEIAKQIKYTGEFATTQDLTNLKEILESAICMLSDLSIPKEGLVSPGSFIFELFSKVDSLFESKDTFLRTLEMALAMLQDSVPDALENYLSNISSIINSIFDKSLQEFAISFKIFISEENSSKFGTMKKVRKVNCWCFNAGLAMGTISKLVRNIILTSGTLAPMESFALELKIPFDIRLENPHVINSPQIWVGVISKGPSSKILNSSFKNRNEPEYKSELGNSIVNFCRIIPNGILVFFPSYDVLSSCISHWQSPNNNIWESLTKFKYPIVEPRESYQCSLAIQDFYSKCRSSNGAIFFAVCRGKVSEGIDFSDSYGRAVIITGIPFPNKNDHKVTLKQQYLQEGHSKLKPNEWYTQQASRAVNQAVGRIIRHRNDYGAIILADERFCDSSCHRQLSKWIQPHIKIYTSFGECTQGLVKFFKNKNQTIEPITLQSLNNCIVNTSNLTVEKETKPNTVLSESLTNPPLSILKTLNVDEEKQKREKAKDYINTAKKTLTKEEYQVFRGLLKDFKASNLELKHLIQRVLDLFSNSKKSVLLKDFGNFIPPKHQKKYEAAVVQKLLELDEFNQKINRKTKNFLEDTETNFEINNSNSKALPIELLESYFSPEELVTMNAKIIPNYNEISTPFLTSNPILDVPNENSKPLLNNTKPTNNEQKNNHDSLFPKQETPKVNFFSSPNKLSSTSPTASNSLSISPSKKSKRYDLITGQTTPMKKMKLNPRNSIELKRSNNLNHSESSQEQSSDCWNSQGNENSENVEQQQQQVLSSLLEQNNETEKFKTVNDTEKRTCCPICQEIPITPQQARCGHIMCAECWKSWLLTKLECPLCRSKVRFIKLKNVTSFQ